MHTAESGVMCQSRHLSPYYLGKWYADDDRKAVDTFVLGCPLLLIDRRSECDAKSPSPASAVRGRRGRWLWRVLGGRGGLMNEYIG